MRKMLPTGWMTIRLDEVCDIVRGGRQGLSGKDFIDFGGYPAYGAGGHNGNLPTYEFEGDGIVLSTVGARCGKCFQPSGRWSSMANTTVVFPHLDRADTRFLWYQLNDEQSWHRSGTAQPYIKPADIKGRKVLLPPLCEQKRLAAILDAADALRAKRRESLELLDKLVQSVFLDMFGDPVTNPKGLPTKPLYEVAPLQRGFDLPVGKRRQGGVPVLASNGPVGFHDEPKVRGPGVVTGRSGTLGKVKFIQRDFWPLNTTLWVTDFHGNEPRWIAQLLELFRFDRFSRGVGVPTLNRNLVHVEHVPVPPVPEQIKFAEIWQAQEVHRNRLESHLAALDTLFASLQSRAFRGEL